MSRLSKVREAVKLLNAYLHSKDCSGGDLFNAAEATFELLDQPWTEVEIEPLWKEGYEQCMTDIVDAMADEWGLPIWAQLGELE